MRLAAENAFLASDSYTYRELRVSFTTRKKITIGLRHDEANEQIVTSYCFPVHQREMKQQCRSVMNDLASSGKHEKSWEETS